MTQVHPEGFQAANGFFSQIEDTLRVLHGCSRALLSASHEQPLLQEVCDVVVREGRYPFAVLGLRRFGHDIDIRPIAYAGANAGAFLAEPTIWGGASADEGPALTAVRTGRINVARRIASDTRFLPWRNRARECGYESVLSIPLVVDHEVLGALIVYSAEPERFQDAEAQLFGQIVKSVALGIATIRTRQRQQIAEQALQNANFILRGIHRAQSAYISASNPQASFEQLLMAILELTGSQFGFIGEVLRDDAGTACIRIVALSNVAWDAHSQNLYKQAAAGTLYFRNLESLFGAVVTTRQTVISNTPMSDPRRGGMPPGHPELRAFMGLPLWRGNELVGLVGIANRAGGYEESLESDIEPLLLTCGSMIAAYRNEKRRQEAEELLAIENRALAIITQSRPIQSLLDELLRLTETCTTNLRSAILLADESKSTLNFLVGQRIPPLFREYVDELPIVENAPSCSATAAYRRQFTCMCDLPRAADPPEYWKFARDVGFRAVWATPILAGDGALIGTFSMYSPESRTPTEFERRLMDKLAGVAALAIERSRIVSEGERSELRFRSVFEHATVGQAVLDIYGKFTHVNHAFLSMLDRRQADVVGQRLHRFVRRGDECLNDSDLTRLLRGQTGNISREQRWLRRDGDEVWIRSTISAVFPQGGEPQLMAQFVNIGGEKRAQELESQLGRILENSLSEIYVIDPNVRQFFVVNRGGRENLGYDPHELHALRPADVDATWREDTAGALLAPLLDGDVEQMSYRSMHRRKDGSHYPIEGHVQLFEHGDRVQFVLMVKDVTESEANAERLRRFERIVSTANDFVGFVDQRLVVQTVNKTFVRAFGRPADEIVGRGIHELYDDEIQDRPLIRALERALTGRNERIQLKREYADGYHEIDMQLNPYVEQGGEVTGVVVCGRDITDLRDAENALFQSEERFRAVYDENPSMLFTLDGDARIVSVNQLGAGRLANSVQGLLDRSMTELLTQDSDAEFRRFHGACFRQPGQVVKTEVCMRHSAGGSVPFRLTGRAIVDAAGDSVLLLACEELSRDREALTHSTSRL